MAVVKISVLKTNYDKELSAQYGAAEVTGPCTLHMVGQEIYCDRHYQPPEICGEAWKAMQHYVYALYHGATVPFGKGWMKKAGVAIVTCNDGLRPVTFKLERVEA